jgi:G6PDH family F420-dependent oxidoreductase
VSWKGTTRFKISVDLGENYNDPMQFIECVEVAAEYQFEAAWFGDHLFPFIHSGRKSSFVWSMLPAALDRTHRIKVGPNVTCPIGGRYHPFIIAQAAATIDNMYPGRFLLAVGSGEAINEARFFPKWPKWKERIGRLVEAVQLIRLLWNSDNYFSFDGSYFSLKDVFLYTKPKTKIPIYFSALGSKAASLAGMYGDHLVTINPVERAREIIAIFEAAANAAGKNSTKMEKMVFVGPVFSDERTGIEELRRTHEGVYLAEGAFEMQDPREIERKSDDLTDDMLAKMVYFCPTADDVIELVARYQKAGATHVTISTQSDAARIRMIGEKVLPHFIHS